MQEQILNYEVATVYKETTKAFAELKEALTYFKGLQEEAALWDFTGDDAVLVEYK